MSKVTDKLVASINEHFGDSVAVSVAFDEVTMVVDSKDIVQVCTDLRDKPELAFEELVDCCGVDYLTFGQVEWETGSATGSGFSRGVAETEAPSGEQVSSHRFAAVYHLLSLKNNCRLRVKTYLSEDAPVLDSVVDVWASANWFEREAWDLMGIRFRGHPRLVRILTHAEFVGHALRKDYHPAERHRLSRTYDLFTEEEAGAPPAD